MTNLVLEYVIFKAVGVKLNIYFFHYSSAYKSSFL